VIPSRVPNEQELRGLFAHSADVRIRSIEFGDPGSKQTVVLVYCSGLIDSMQVNLYVLPRLEQWLDNVQRNPAAEPEMEVLQLQRPDEIVTRIFKGQLVICCPGINRMFALDLSDPPERSPNDSNTEISIKGPRDGFVESLHTNLALIRKRLPVTTLHIEQYTIGTDLPNTAALLYLEGKARQQVIDEARKRLKHLQIDAIAGSSQLEELISDHPFSLFPTITYTGRPDFLVGCLLRGRFAILVDNSPMAVVAPVNFGMLLRSPEDVYSPFFIAAGEMVLRLAGLVIALLLPGFWVALSAYNMEQLPYPLLATLVQSRIGLPLPGPLEALLMLGLFELFRESGIRLPKAIGQTMAVVGGIVIGDAVIRAGLASTTMLIVSAITAVATFILVNQTLAGGVTLARFLVLIASAFLGIYGFILAVIGIILYLARLESFGVPYMTPVTPVKPKQLLAGIFKKPLIQGTKPLPFLRSPSPDRKGEKKP
jgi:hypothetical protein